MDSAYESRGRAGLQSLGALLNNPRRISTFWLHNISWSRLINELRKSVVDSHCGNRTKMIDLRYGKL